MPPVFYTKKFVQLLLALHFGLLDSEKERQKLNWGYFDYEADQRRVVEIAELVKSLTSLFEVELFDYSGHLPQDGQLILTLSKQRQLKHDKKPTVKLARNKRSSVKMDPTPFAGYYSALPSLAPGIRYPYPATTATGATGRGMIFYPQPMSVESLESLEAQDLELDQTDPSGSPGLVKFIVEKVFLLSS